MADYFETEEVVKEYDSRITGRILSYLKPYKFLTALALFALIFSTLGELLVPVLQQRLIDRAVMSRFLALKLDGNPPEAFSGKLGPEAFRALAELTELRGVLSAGDYLFIPRDEKLAISEKAERELRSGGILEEGQWYAFPLPRDAENVRAVIADHQSMFVAGPGAAALRAEDLAALSPEEKELVRSGDLSLITRMVIILLSVLVLIFLFTFVETWTSVMISQRVMKDIRLELFQKTASQSTAFLSRNPVGRIVTRLTGDVETINEFFTSVLIAFLKDFSVMAGSLVTLFILSPRLAAVVLLTLPPVLLVTGFSRVKARDAFRRQRTASSRLNSYLSERLSGIQVVQLFLGERRSRREFEDRDREYLKANMAEMYVYAVFRPIIDFLSTLTTAAVIAVGANFVLNLSLSLGVLIAFINLVGLFYSPVMDIAEKYTLLQSAMAGGERVFALLDTKERIPAGGTRHIESEGKSLVRGRVEFKDVVFFYKEREPVLKNVSFTVNPGEMAAIVGYTGAGKTTVTSILTRLWDIQQGGITLDGIPLKEIPLEELRRAVLPVLQEVFLFSGTVADNISLGLPLSREQIAGAARAVHAHEFIERLPQGYDTILSEGAVNISSGQRQLLSFARVIAHNPALVILDEATSSIDTETERLIQMGIQRILSGRTSIVIAHRLSTIRHADRILVLSGGRLVEEGKHDALIAQNGLYAGLYRLQFEADQDGAADI
ncbi:MAG: ABC transporter ATP-binding protein/permease [Spirochaetaceae bacterium]|jgi:ATP-binding cassette subfamily B protein|nr:ABC transporter ATP-binding protein/permease [Spirochaetaceae bacterium]